jgi:Domain of unknown function (DUF4126)
VELIPTAISAGYAAGLNAYGTVVMLNLLGRAGFGEVPDGLTTDPVLIGAAVMYAIEFVTDKVPYLDNAWDLLHTAIRPAIGSLIGVEFADLDQVTGAETAAAGGAGGGTALVSHGLKAGLRLGINASPEPASNILVSLTEDGIVAGVIALVLKEPLIALAVVIILLAIGIGLVLFLRNRIKRALERRRERKRGPPSQRRPPRERDLPAPPSGP